MAADLPSTAGHRGWMMESRSGRMVLWRTDPLIVEGERLGNFDCDSLLAR
jgi:hypothetical protein